MQGIFRFNFLIEFSVLVFPTLCREHLRSYFHAVLKQRTNLKSLFRNITILSLTFSLLFNCTTFLSRLQIVLHVCKGAPFDPPGSIKFFKGSSFSSYLSIASSVSVMNKSVTWGIKDCLPVSCSGNGKIRAYNK